MMKFCCFLFIAFLLLSGCESTDSGRVFTFSDNVHSETLVPLSENKQNKFHFKIAGLNVDDVKSKIILEVKRKLSSEFLNKNVPLRKNQDTFGSVIETLNKNSNIRLYSKLDWGVSVDGVSMSYETIRDYNGRQAVAYQRFLIGFVFDYDPKNQLLTLFVNYPEFYTERNGNLGSEAMIIPPFESEQLKAHINSSFESISITRIGYYKEKKISGEFVVNYRDDSVYANFIRLGVNDTIERKIEKTAQISLSRGDMNYVTNIHVYPYRDTKSKVVYESYLKSVQWINSDGTTSFDNFPDDKEIEKMISDIANG